MTLRMKPPMPPLYLPSTAESETKNGGRLESSNSSGPTGTFELRGHYSFDNKERDISASPRDGMKATKNVAEMEGSLFVESQVLEADQQVLHTPQNATDNPVADAPHQEDVTDQQIATFLPLAISEDLESSVRTFPEESEESDYEDGGQSSSSSNEEDVGQMPINTSDAMKKSIKTRRKIATNAREYVARLHEEEDKKYAKKMQQEEERKASTKRSCKRKLTQTDNEPCKIPKTWSNGGPSRFSDGTSTSDGNSLLPMEPIKARTHAEQFAQLKAQIPQNCDTRRRKTQRQDLQEAAKLFGYKRVEAQNGRWKLKGMATSLEGY
ncbi:hypothetical protein V8C37DRAFT_414144 [Trichoderma ceciliae]